MFKHQRSDPGTFPVFQCLNDRMMLAVRKSQRFVHAGKVDFIERNRVRSSEWDPTVALKRFGDHSAPSPLNDKRMELLVHLAVSSFIGLDQMSFGENLITLSQAFVKGLDQSARRALLSKHAGSQPLEHSANIDGVHNLLRCERTHYETARVELGQHTLLREDGQRFANRSSRNAELSG